MQAVFPVLLVLPLKGAFPPFLPRDICLWHAAAQRQPKTWKYYYGLATKEIAAALDMKENTIDQRARRGLQKLREVLKEGGFYG